MPHHSALLRGIELSHSTDGPSVASSSRSHAGLLHTKSSIANLVRFVRNPLERVSEVTGCWRDTSRDEESARKQSLENKRQILYVRLREVHAMKRLSLSTWETDQLCRQLLTRIGKMRQALSMRLRATMSGRLWWNLPITMPAWWRPD